MPLRISGKQLNKLGKRLASREPITDADYALLAQVAEDYQAVLDKVEARLQDLGYQATTRVKTTGTLQDKLRRSPHLPLKNIHDVAGARIVIDGDREEQDRVAARIVQAFADCPKVPEPIDRRKEPSHGYRAFHVVVYEEGIPVEIQIRTKLQDTWAQITEKLGDAWGRGLRYGLGPDQPNLLAAGGTGEGVTRGELMQVMMRLSDAINVAETLEPAFAKLPLQALEGQLGVIVSEHRETRVQMQKHMESLLATVSRLGRAE
jgi:Region found in RelA / SpoT proteins